MKPAEKPENELSRLEELRSFSILDTEAEKDFDEVTRLAANICGTEFGAISLIDSERQWFKSKIGFDLCETSRDESFCAHAILSDDLMVIEDTSADERFKDTPGVKFYAGAPLITSTGARIGTLCVFDSTCRTLNKSQRDALVGLSRHVVELLVLRKKNIELKKRAFELESYARGLNKHAIIAKTDFQGRIIFANDTFCKISGYSREELIGKSHRIVNSGYHPPEFFKEIWDTIKAGHVWRGEIKNRAKDGTFYWVDTTICPSIDEKGEIIDFMAYRYDITERKNFEEQIRKQEIINKLVFDQSLDAMLTIGAPYDKFMSANEACLKLFKAPSLEAFKQLGPGALSPKFQPDGELSSEKAKRMTVIALEKGGHFFEWVHQKFDGTPFICTVLLNPLTDEATSYMQVTIRDITDAKRSEENLVRSKKELQRSYQYLNLALETGNLGIWDWNLKTGAVNFDRRWSDMLGLKHHEIRFDLAFWESRIHPDDYPKCFAALMDYVEGRTHFYEHVHRMKHADGRWVYILDRGKFSDWDENGKPIRFTGIHFDLTEYKQLENDLLDAQSVSKTGSWNFDFKTGALSWSPEHYKIFEIASPQPSETLYKLYRERIHPDDIPVLDEVMKKAMTEGKSFTFDHRVILDGGKRIKYVQGIGSVQKDDNGNPISLRGTCSDRTEDIENEERYRQLVEAMSEGFVVMDNSGRITRFNSSALKILEVNSEELNNSSMKDFNWQGIREDGSVFPPEEYPSAVVLKTGEAVHNVIMGMTFPGSITKWIRVNAVPVRKSNGNHVLVTFSDITEMKKAMDENRFVMDTVGIGVWKFDCHTGEQVWDKSMYPLYGMKPTGSKNDFETWRMFLTPEARRKVTSDWESIQKGAKEINSTYEIRTADGHKKFIGSRAIVIRNHKGEPEMMYGVNWDKTESYELEQRLENEKAKAFHNAKLASIGQLAAGVGHEINNPLAIIAGQVAIAEQLILSHDRPDREVLERFKKIESSVNRIANIVKGLRTFARSDDNQIVHFDPYDVMVETVEMLKEIYEREEVSLSISGAKKGSNLKGNRGRLQQVLVNLISNAKDATIGVADRNIQVIVTYDEDHIRLEVKDNGCGIPANLKDKIFEPFFTTKEVNNGTGIGLSLVNTIVKELAGNIKVESEPGKGTSFIVTLPVSLSVQAEPLKPLIEKKPVQNTVLNWHALIVDDEEDLREILKYVMLKICSKVTVAKDVPEAMEKLGAESVDVILSDVKMPGIDGFQFLKMVREMKNLSQPKFLFISGGVDMDKNLQKIVEQESDGFLPKPFKADVISKKLQELYSKSQTVKLTS